MTTHKEFLGLFMNPDADKQGHVHVRAVYRIVTNENWEHPTIKLGERLYLSDHAFDAAFRIALESATPGYVALRKRCFEVDGYKEAE
jgi:hypothetical protein